QVHRDHVGLSVRDQRPRQLPGPEVVRDVDGKHAPLTPREKMRRLALIRTARLDLVLRSDGDVEVLFGIPVEVADEQVDAAVAVPVPAFECAGDTRSALADRGGQPELTRWLTDPLVSG